MKHLYYMRHGLTFDNIEGRLSGHSDSELTPEGHNQAKMSGEEAKQNGLSWDVIVCSPLQRTRHTAEHVAEAVDYPKEKILNSDLLLERNFGDFEAKTLDEFLHPNTSFVYRNLDYIPGTESFEELYNRAKIAHNFLDSLEGDRVLVVSHGAFGRAFEHVILNRPVEYEYRNDNRGRFPNAKIFKLI